MYTMTKECQFTYMGYQCSLSGFIHRNVNAKFHGLGVPEWTSQPPHEQKTRVRIPPGYKVF
jgi:hypothetical protein